jgi:hypothetical protein
VSLPTLKLYVVPAHPVLIVPQRRLRGDPRKFAALVKLEPRLDDLLDEVLLLPRPEPEFLCQ